MAALGFLKSVLEGSELGLAAPGMAARPGPSQTALGLAASGRPVTGRCGGTRHRGNPAVSRAVLHAGVTVRQA